MQVVAISMRKCGGVECSEFDSGYGTDEITASPILSPSKISSLVVNSGSQFWLSILSLAANSVAHHTDVSPLHPV